jgi:hypothetical protein
VTTWVWPFDPPPKVRSFRLRPYNIQALASQTQELIPGGLMVQRFEAKLTFPPMVDEQWRDHSGLLAEIAGIGGRVRLWDNLRKEPYYNKLVEGTVANWDDGSTWDDGTGWLGGKLPPFVTVAETARRGATNILLKGFPPSLEGVLRRGDLWEAQPNGEQSDFAHLYEVTRRANSNSEGLTRVYFRAGLRAGLRTGDKVVIGGAGVYPSSIFRLASDDEGDIEVDEAHHGQFGVSFIEVLPHGIAA